ncbi:pilus assembly protein [Ralstonia pseudosolanacearum]|uniref:pilus assembly protein n=1 Tax=Ralstonia pseudosolanacearum TaxID=1310165 RepID=UPI001FF84DB2|nr:pilus assembly protein [Ralstonia pseudosolanacearum]
MKIIRGLVALVALGWITLLGAASTVPTVDISTVPLYGRSQNIHPNLMLSLSVEFPTTGAAYRSSYDENTTYLGYFNSAKCYNYDSNNGWFVIATDATADTHECSGQFSGNFMNWAASSAIDEFRLAMTGGDRVVDTTTQTVLQRAVLRDDFFRKSSNFPVKSYGSPSTVTPFSNWQNVSIASCGNHIFFADRDYPTYRDRFNRDVKTSCASPGGYGDQSNWWGGTERRAFRVQVQVCDSNEATTRTDLCFNYNGNYKPVGQIQLNADRMRFGAFGYLNDSNAQNERYGGVLRAPMRYVGTSAVDRNLNAIQNTAPELDPATGILIKNPLGASEGISGVINYLNQFGRTSVQLPGKAMGDLGRPTDNPTGNYKTYDPVSELFYESVRYLQYKQGPTPEAIRGLPNTTYSDNFPVYTAWGGNDPNSDPLLNGCQRNYVFVIGDINTHQDHYIPGNMITNMGDPMRPVSSYDNFDVMQWTNKVGALETNNPPAGNSNPLSKSFTNLASRPTANSASYYMAGVAYWAHTYGFRPDMPDARVTTFVIDVNEYGDGTIGDTQRQSQFFLAAKYGGFIDSNGDSNPFQAKGQDGSNVASNSEWEASPTGSNVPYNWFLAGQPDAMISSIKKIFTQITSYAGTLAGVALSNGRITTTTSTSGGTFVYTPGFDQQWNGRLAAYPLILNGTTIGTSSTPTWEAGSLLTTAMQQANGPTNRAVYTLKSDTLTGTPFNWTGISSAQQKLLSTNPDRGTADSNGPARLAYLRGDRSNEMNAVANTGMFRARSSILGDIIGSAPAYAAAPSASISDTGYAKFYNTYKGRTPMVYVGANDGMLHGLNANTGAEVFAYVPNAVFSNLNQLTSVAYAHRPYADATPNVGDVQINGKWRSVLTGGFGGGAQGIYALDVTDPTGTKEAAFSSSNVMWEFTDKDDADMGNVMGSPITVKLRTGTDSTTKQPIYKWFVMVANGLNSNQNDGNANPNAPAALFLLSLDKPAGAAWQLGTNYYKIVTPAPGATPPYSTANGLSSPTVILSANGSVMHAYAGDLQGNLWKFVLSGDSTTWKADTALPAYGGTAGTPLFAATDTFGRRQPITIAPRVIYAPGGYMVLFGTGKYYESADTGTPTQINSFYGIYDDNSNSNYVKNRDKLNTVKASLSADGKAVVLSSSDYALGYSAGRYAGWKLDFPDQTEKQVTAITVSDGIVIFNSLTGSDGCGTTGGSNSYTLNALTGMPLSGNLSGYKSTTGVLGAPTLIIVSVTNTARDTVGGGMQTTTKIVLSPGAQGLTIGSLDGAPTPISGQASIDNAGVSTSKRGFRLGWREVRNFVLQTN